MIDRGAPVALVIHACELSTAVGRGVLGLFGIRCKDPERQIFIAPLYWRDDGVLPVPPVVAGLVGMPFCLLGAVIAWATS
jgi:hypothetical protein